jgi:hypothetical protein
MPTIFNENLTGKISTVYKYFYPGYFLLLCNQPCTNADIYVLWYECTGTLYFCNNEERFCESISCGLTGFTAIPVQ